MIVYISAQDNKNNFFFSFQETFFQFFLLNKDIFDIIRETDLSLGRLGMEIALLNAIENQDKVHCSCLQANMPQVQIAEARFVLPERYVCLHVLFNIALS